mmetsp:Transcript_7671/g.13866  ORF Transcript_7671/g.13866 Transcript_7671/m.13866 type:complete len:85 (+) Transcript_7671:1526-1780(+)
MVEKNRLPTTGREGLETKPAAGARHGASDRKLAKETLPQWKKFTLRSVESLFFLMENLNDANRRAPAFAEIIGIIFSQFRFYWA